MNNPFSAKRNDMLGLYIASRKHMAQVWLDELSKKYLKEEIERQMAVRAGPAVDKMNEMIDTLARKTENVEFVKALALSDFYFGTNVQTDISFEMKSGFVKKPDTTYEELIAGIENSTHIDCGISYGGKQLLFQIKRYPQAHLEHTNDAFIKWLKSSVFAHYGNMKGVTLVVILQPNQPPAPTAFDFSSLSTSIILLAENTFDGITVSYTEQNKKGDVAVLQKLFPTNQRFSVALSDMLGRFR